MSFTGFGPHRGAATMADHRNRNPQIPRLHLTGLVGVYDDGLVTPVYTPRTPRIRADYPIPSPRPAKRRSKYKVVNGIPNAPGEKRIIAGPYVTPLSNRLYPKGAVQYMPRKPITRPVK